MSDWITVKGARYFPAAWLLADSDEAREAAKDIQKRQSFVSSRELRLRRTSGAYTTLGDRVLLLVIDRDTVQPGSEEWRFIGRVAETLTGCYARLSPQAVAALASLGAVVFSRSPARSYADVKPNAFVYDVDEFRRSDQSLITASYAASNIVHDANHIRMFDDGEAHTGQAAEVTCWRLQVDNAEALELDETEVNFLRSLIADPTIVAERIEQDPLAKMACSKLGKCSVTGLA